MSSLHVEDSSDITGVLLDDFTYSFLYSQGYSGLQHEYFDYAASFYRKTFNTEQIKQLADLIDPGAPAWLTLKRHHEHLSYKPYKFKDELASQGRFFQTILRRVINPDITNDNGVTMHDMTSYIIDRDIVYQGKQRGIGDDPHKSYFRQHVLEAVPTGSALFNAIFADMLIEINEDDIALKQCVDLASLWQINHPGQLFDHTQQLAVLV